MNELMMNDSTGCCWKKHPIPVVLYEEIHEYLVELDYCRLMNASKGLFGAIRYETWKPIFSDEGVGIAQRNKPPGGSPIIKNRNHQLIWQIRFPDSQPAIDFCEQFPAYKFILYSFMNREHLHWENMLKNKRHVDIGLFYRVVEFPHLENTESLIIRGGVQKFKSFSHKLRAVRLHQNDTFTDTSPFKNMMELTLDRCELITDVSLLGNIRKLRISDCIGVTDISRLTNNTTLLQVTGCPNICNTPLVMECQHFTTDLELSLQVGRRPENNIETISSSLSPSGFYPTVYSPNLFSIELYHCESISELPKIFKRIPVVSLVKCSELVDISALGENKAVVVEECYQVKRFSSLRFIPKVTLEKCNIVSDGNVDHVEHLILRDCSKFNEINRLGENLQHLELSSWKVTNFNSLHRIPIIEFGEFPRPKTKRDGGNSEPPSYLSALGKEHEKIVFTLSTFPEYQKDFPFLSCYDVVSEHYKNKQIVTLLKKR
jgi:hypothetical protein